MRSWPVLQLVALVAGLGFLFLNFSPSLFIPANWVTAEVVKEVSVVNVGDLLDGPEPKDTYKFLWGNFSAVLFQTPWVPYRRGHVVLIGVIGIASIVARRWRGHWDAWTVVFVTWGSFLAGITTWGLLIRSGLMSPEYLPHWLIWPLVFMAGLAVSLLVLALPWLLRTQYPRGNKDPTSAFKGLPYRPLPLLALKGYSPFAAHFGESPRNEPELGARGVQVLDSVMAGLHDTTAKQGQRPYYYFRCSKPAAHRHLLLVEHKLGYMRRAWCVVEAYTAPGSTTLVVRVHRFYVRNLDWYDLFLVRIPPMSFVRAANRASTQSENRFVSVAGPLLGVCFAVLLVAGVVAYMFTASAWAIVACIEGLLTALVLAAIVGFVEADEPSREVLRASNDLGTAVNLLVPDATGAVRAQSRTSV